ncbi:hypothetical protein NDU88_002658 [Pleurodeles waltl]|uniref:Uncharacterized protein n=1 Tax=Pleurodeles waltl TaxID=8319 RepID=A0AAV7T3W5_PLEWA|nr:hypothetical protein NDU88_002658 [Pleurodeles waltl]
MESELRQGPYYRRQGLGPRGVVQLVTSSPFYPVESTEATDNDGGAVCPLPLDTNCGEELTSVGRMSEYRRDEEVMPLDLTRELGIAWQQSPDNQWQGSGRGRLDQGLCIRGRLEEHFCLERGTLG